jgi:hypothetical protein
MATRLRRDWRSRSTSSFISSMSTWLASTLASDSAIRKSLRLGPAIAAAAVQIMMPVFSIVVLAFAQASPLGPPECRQLAVKFGKALHALKVNEWRPEERENFEKGRRPEKIAHFIELVARREHDPEFLGASVWVSKITPTWGSREPAMSAAGDCARWILISRHIEHERIGLALSGMMFEDTGSRAAAGLCIQRGIVRPARVHYRCHPYPVVSLLRRGRHPGRFDRPAGRYSLPP